MTALYPHVLKETRALAPAWLAIVAAMLAASARRLPLRGWAIPVYFVGVAALAAVSIGHEYSYRTLPMLLAQPVSRRRLLIVKWTTLAVLLLPIAWLADPLFPSGAARTPLLWLPPLFALCVVPLMTMLCRNALAGAVFGMSVPALLLIASDLIARRLYGPPSLAAAQYDAFRIAFVSWASVSICALTAMLIWPAFRRLEAIDGPADLPALKWRIPERWRAGPDVVATRQHPLWVLLKKELHLQRMAIVLAALYLVVRTVAAASVTMDNDVGSVTVILTMVYSGSIAVLIGALAIAEERQLGTHEWQVALPMSVARQGTVKAATAIALSLVLAIGIPVLMLSASPAMWNGRPAGTSMFLRPDIMSTIVVMTAGSLYVSSLCPNGLSALLVSLPALYLADLFASFLAWPLFYTSLGGGRTALLRVVALRRSLRGTFGPDGAAYVLTAALALVVIGICVVVVRLAIANHRYADRRGGRLSFHLASLAVCVVAWVFASGIYMALR
jgi:hypothetical protein